MNRAPHWPHSALLGAFIGGLKPELGYEICMWKPHNLADAIEQANRKDEQLGALKVGVSISRLPTRPSTRAHSTLPGPSALSKRIHVSDEEIQRRRVAGLCFTCEEKYSINHKCPNAKFMRLEAYDIEEEQIEGDEREGADSTCAHVISKLNEAHGIPAEGATVTFNALRDERPRALCFWGRLGPYRVKILVDSGATLNFIDAELANALKLPSAKQNPFNVTSSSGHKLACQASYDRVPVVIDQVEFL